MKIVIVPNRKSRYARLPTWVKTRDVLTKGSLVRTLPARLRRSGCVYRSGNTLVANKTGFGRNSVPGLRSGYLSSGAVLGVLRTS